jgi:RNA polymerase sigma factor (sigma-70 family)
MNLVSRWLGKEKKNLKNCTLLAVRSVIMATAQGGPMSQDPMSFPFAAIDQMVHDALRRRIRDSHLIDDISQEVQRAYWQRVQDGRTLPEPLEPRVRKAAWNRYYSWARGLCRSRKLQAFLRQRREDSSREDPAFLAERNELRKVLISLLDRLPSPDREITKRRLLDGWKFKRIAEEMRRGAGGAGSSVGAVKTRFRRAIDRLAPSVKRAFSY